MLVSLVWGVLPQNVEDVILSVGENDISTRVELNQDVIAPFACMRLWFREHHVEDHVEDCGGRLIVMM